MKLAIDCHIPDHVRSNYDYVLTLCLQDLGFLYYVKTLMYFLTNISGGTTHQMQKYVRPHCKK